MSNAASPDLGTLRRLAGGWGVSLDETTLARFERYRELLLAANQRVNLTAITDPRGRHHDR